MESTTGRRETHKRETKAALRQAAARLFAERGVEASTVREIAAAAGVTERTFYRYFDGKEELIAEQALAWIERLHNAVCDRPSDEPPYEAVQEALLAVAREAERSGADGAWLFGETARPGVLRHATARPLLRVERSIASALLARGHEDAAGAGSPTHQEQLAAELLARVAVAVLRTALISHRRFRDAGDASPGLHALIGADFATLRTVMRQRS